MRIVRRCDFIQPRSWDFVRSTPYSIFTVLFLEFGGGVNHWTAQVNRVKAYNRRPEFLRGGDLKKQCVVNRVYILLSVSVSENDPMAQEGGKELMHFHNSVRISNTVYLHLDCQRA